RAAFPGTVVAVMAGEGLPRGRRLEGARSGVALAGVPVRAVAGLHDGTLPVAPEAQGEQREIRVRDDEGVRRASLQRNVLAGPGQAQETAFSRENELPAVRCGVGADVLGRVR